MKLNDVAMLVITIATLEIRFWKMRKVHRRNTDGPDQLAD